MAYRAGDDGTVHRITAVPRAHSEDLDGRVRRYVISMSIRTVCLILVLVIDHPVRWAFALGAILLPYVAVVMANAGKGRRSTLDSVSVEVNRPALSAASVPVPRDRAEP